MTDATLLHGACDLHIHFGPDTTPRKMNALETARAAAAAGMRAILLKCHQSPTQGVAACADAAVDGVRVFGGLVLNAAVGGINPAAVKAACAMGAKQVWMPTASAEQHLRHFGGAPETAVPVFDSKGRPVPHLEEVLGLIAEADVILGTGHLSPAESVRIANLARACGVKKILVTHPEFECVAMPTEMQKSLAAKGIFFERCFYASMSRQGLPVESIAAQILAVGYESTVLSSDMGQPENPAPALALADFLQRLAACGLPCERLRRMVCDAPAALLGLEPPCDGAEEARA